MPNNQTTYAAHSKFDEVTGEWIHFGLQYGETLKAHITIMDEALNLIHHRVIDFPTYPYIHDFLVTERFIVFILPAAKFDTTPFLLGLKPMSRCLTFTPETGNLVMLVDRYEDSEPVIMEAPPSFIWHTLNAYERGTEIIAEFVGYDDLAHFSGTDGGFYAIMTGRAGDFGAPGTVRRYIINRSNKTVTEEILKDGMNEFPMVNPAFMCHQHRFSYITTRAEAGLLTGVCRLDTQTGDVKNFDFGPGTFVGEAIFVPQAGALYEAGSTSEPGHILVEGYDGDLQRSFLAIFDAEHVEDGPVAKVWMQTHVPISFHGCWVGQG